MPVQIEEITNVIMDTLEGENIGNCTDFESKGYLTRDKGFDLELVTGETFHITIQDIS